MSLNDEFDRWRGTAEERARKRGVRGGSGPDKADPASYTGAGRKTSDKRSRKRAKPVCPYCTHRECHGCLCCSWNGLEQAA